MKINWRRTIRVRPVTELNRHDILFAVRFHWKKFLSKENMKSLRLVQLHQALCTLWTICSIWFAAPQYIYMVPNTQLYLLLTHKSLHETWEETELKLKCWRKCTSCQYILQNCTNTHTMEPKHSRTNIKMYVENFYGVKTIPKRKFNTTKQQPAK